MLQEVVLGEETGLLVPAAMLAQTNQPPTTLGRQTSSRRRKVPPILPLSTTPSMTLDF